MPPIPSDGKKVFTWLALLAAGILLCVEGISVGIDFSKAADKLTDVASTAAENGYELACKSEGCTVSNCAADCDIKKKDLQPPAEFADDYDTPGLGVTADAVMSLWLFITVALMAVGTLPRVGLQPLIAAIVNIIAGVLLLLGAIAAIFMAIGKLMVMLGLLVAFPFGPLIYLGIFGWFARGAAAATLTAALVLKVVAGVLLFLGDRGVLKSPSAMLMFILALVSGVIVMFLHAIVPIVLVSITDAVAALIVGVIVAIWSLISLILFGIVQGIVALVGLLNARPPG